MPTRLVGGLTGKTATYGFLLLNDLSIFQFGKNRSAQVPLAVFGKEPLKGTLVVDRYNGYNKVPCSIQYCYAHLTEGGGGPGKGVP